MNALEGLCRFIEHISQSSFHFSKPFHIFWLLTESDFWTFVVPDIAFGILGALAGPILTTNASPDFIEICSRLPSVLSWNWLNLAIFDLANQRSPESVAEDGLNKPWQPVPSGLTTSTQMRRILLVAIPLVLASNYYLGAWEEITLLFALTWMYNDLHGGDEDFVLRNLIICAAFACYHSGSLRIASGPEHLIHSAGRYWIILISTVIFCTMQVQDLKDVTGDRVRKRRTAPLVFGDRLGRWTIAAPVVFWSVACPLYVGVGFISQIFAVAFGGHIAFRILYLYGPKADRTSWYVWACWLLCLYALPLIKHYSVILDLQFV